MILFIVILGAQAKAKETKKKMILAISGAFNYVVTIKILVHGNKDDYKIRRNQCFHIHIN